MKNLKNTFAILVIALTILLIGMDRSQYVDIILKLFILLIVCLFIFNLLVRHTSWSKSYFTSKFNLLTNKFHYKKEFEFSKNILFHKLMEVLEKTNFNVVRSNEKTGEILALSSFNSKSWGENIYIELKEINEITELDFYSTTIFQVFSWGKNEENYKRLLSEFEASLII